MKFHWPLYSDITSRKSLCVKLTPSNLYLYSNNNKKFRSFKSKENIHKKEIGPYHYFGY